jgi:uncharacterized protein YcbK (DUF882 family)
MKLKRKTKFWLVVSAILALLVSLLVLWTVHKVKDWRWRHAGAIENHPVRIWDVNFTKEFNDLNEVQLAVAQAVGVPPVEDRDAAEHMKKRLVEIVDNDLYSVDELTHSIPFLVPSAAELLDRIGRNFQDSLSAKGLNPNKLVVTSVLRTEEDVRKLRQGNINASENSTHRYGTTFDISYWHYVKVPDLRERPYADVPPEYLRATLSQVLKDLHDEGACYVKYEKKQTCFHITVRK